MAPRARRCRDGAERVTECHRRGLARRRPAGAVGEAECRGGLVDRDRQVRRARGVVAVGGLAGVDDAGPGAHAGDARDRTRRRVDGAAGAVGGGHQVGDGARARRGRHRVERGSRVGHRRGLARRRPAGAVGEAECRGGLVDRDRQVRRARGVVAVGGLAGLDDAGPGAHAGDARDRTRRRVDGAAGAVGGGHRVGDGARARRGRHRVERGGRVGHRRGLARRRPAGAVGEAECRGGLVDRDRQVRRARGVVAVGGLAGVDDAGPGAHAGDARDRTRRRVDGAAGAVGGGHRVGDGARARRGRHRVERGGRVGHRRGLARRRPAGAVGEAECRGGLVDRDRQVRRARGVVAVGGLAGVDDAGPGAHAGDARDRTRRRVDGAAGAVGGGHRVGDGARARRGRDGAERVTECHRRGLARRRPAGAVGEGERRGGGSYGCRARCVGDRVVGVNSPGASICTRIGSHACRRRHC